MKKTIFLVAVTTIAVSVFLGSGCGKNENTGGLAPKAIESPAVKNSFQEVTAKLDPGGNVYFYLSTEQWLAGLSDKIEDWRGVANSLPGVKGENQQNIARGFDVVTSLVKDSGIEEVSGFGMSAIEREKGFYHSKFVLHHYPGKGSGYLWTMFGKGPHALTGLELLPATTVLAIFSDADLSLVWSVLDKELGNSGIPGSKEALAKLPGQFAAATGLKLETVLASLGNEFGLVITLDDSKKISVPFGARPMEIPEPGIMLVIKVKDDVIFNRMDELLKSNPQVVRTDNGGLKMRTMPIPLPLPISLRPSVARSGDYLFIATTDTMIEEALAVKSGKKPGLKSTDEFKHLASGMPDKGNHFSYISQRFGETWERIQGQIMEQKVEDKPGQAELMKKLMSLNGPTYAFNVSANTEEGWVGAGNGNQNPAKLVLLPALAVPAVLAAVALPAFNKAKEKSKTAACINNLRQIDGAKQEWALEKKRTEDEIPAWADLKPYLGGTKQPTCPDGGVYKINKVSEPPTCSISGHSLEH